MGKHAFGENEETFAHPYTPKHAAPAHAAAKRAAAKHVAARHAMAKHVEPMNPAAYAAKHASAINTVASAVSVASAASATSAASVASAASATSAASASAVGTASVSGAAAAVGTATSAASTSAVGTAPVSGVVAVAAPPASAASGTASAACAAIRQNEEARRTPGNNCTRCLSGPQKATLSATKQQLIDRTQRDAEPKQHSHTARNGQRRLANGHAAPEKNKQHGRIQSANVARSTALMSIATLGSRATGLIRTWAMAFVLGNSFLTSSYQVANNMPNTIYELVVGGILGAAFIPIFLLQKQQKSEKDANDFACNVLNLFLIILSLLSLVAIVLAPQVIWTQTFAEGSSQEVIDQAVRFFRIFAIQILFYGIGGVVTGMLNANRVYFLPSLAPALNNVIVIVSFFAYIPLSEIDANMALNLLAVGTSLGVVAQFAIQIPALIRGGFRYRWFIDLRDPALREAVRIALPTFLYIVGTMISFSCRNAFSLQAGDNGPSTLIYAWTWYQLPHGVLAVSLSRALFTEMSDSAAKNDWKSVKRHVSSGISGILLLMIPMAFLLGALATPLMQLFRAGAFSMDDVRFVASILALWAISLPFYSISMFIYNVYASIRKFSVFAAISCGLVIVQVALYALLCGNGSVGLYGVPIADLVYYGLLCIIGLTVLRKYIGGGINYKHVFSISIRTCIASALGAGIASLLLNMLSGILAQMGANMLTGLIQLCVCGIIGLVVSFGLCLAFRIPEMKRLAQHFKR